MKHVLLCALSVSAAMAAGTQPKVKLPGSHADLTSGQKLFQNHCALCHGPKGEGGRGPLLTRAKLSRAPDDSTLLKVIEDGIRGTEMPGASLSEREIKQTAAYVRSLGKVPQKPVPGNAARGGETYSGKGCANCHSIKGHGGVSGPDLAAIGARRSAAYLTEAVVNPGTSLPDGYLLLTVISKNGQSVTGVRLNEDSFSLQVQDNDGRAHSFWKHEIEQVQKQRGKSPMPSYKGKLSDEEITDLVAYLASLKEEK
ncbi:MAG: c-type cytochrome [Bryobacteraceae bacterium]